MSRFPVQLELGNQYNITFTGTNPRDMRFHIRGDINNIGTILSIQYQSPELLELSINGNVIPPQNSMVNLSNPTGSNYYEILARRLNFLVKGPQIVKIRTLDAVQVSLALQTTVKEFYDGGGEDTFIDRISYVLGIDPARVKIDSVRAGSVLIDFAILSINETVPTSVNYTNNRASLQDIADLLTKKINSNELNLNATIMRYSISVSVDPPLPCLPECTAVNSYCNNGVCECVKGYEGNGSICEKIKTDNGGSTSSDDFTTFFTDGDGGMSSGGIAAVVISIVICVAALIVVAYIVQQKYYRTVNPNSQHHQLLAKDDIHDVAL